MAFPNPYLPFIEFNNYLNHFFRDEHNRIIFDEMISEVEENQKRALYNAFNHFGYIFKSSLHHCYMHYWNFYEKESYNELYSFILSKNLKNNRITYDSSKGVNQQYSGHKKFVVDLLKTLKPSIPIPPCSNIIFQETQGFFFNMDLKNLHSCDYFDGVESSILGFGKHIKTTKWKVYRGVYLIYYKDFPTACKLFMECIYSFAASELMTYFKFIKYVVYLSVLCLPRNLLLKEIIENENVIAVLAGDKETRTFLHSFYYCDYPVFFATLAIIERRLKMDILFHHHSRYYYNEMKVRAYNQVMKPYTSLPLSYLSDLLKHCKCCIEKDLAVFIKSGRLSFRINLQTDRVEVQRHDEMSKQFQQVIKEGDILLTKIERLLYRIIHI